MPLWLKSKGRPAEHSALLDKIRII